MTQFDKGFMELYDKFDLDLETPAFTSEDTVRIQKMVLDRVEVPGRSARRSTRLLLVAAVMACMVLAVAAAYYSVSDAFRGVFVEQDSTGERVPPAATAPLIDRSGKLLENTVVSGGIEVTLRAVVGDESELKLLVDIEDPSGKPLALTLPDGSLSDGDLRFDQAVVEMLNHPDGHEGFVDDFGRRYGNVGIGWGSEVMDNDPTDNKSTILFNFSIDENIHDKEFTLTLINLMQFAEMAGSSSGIQGETLAELATRFGDHADDEFESNGWMHDHETDTTTYYYDLMTDSGEIVPLAGTSGVHITNAALWNGNFYLRGTADSHQIQQNLFHNAALVNPATGAAWEVNGTGKDTKDDGTVVWTADFLDITLEDLRDCVWMTDYGFGMYVLAEGEWEFNFTLDYENNTRTQSLNRAFTWFGARLNAKRMAVSPFGLSLDFDGDKTARDILSPDRDWDAGYQEGSEWETSPKTIILTMTDGSVVEASDPGYSISWREDGSGEYEMNYSFEVVIDPANLASVQVGDMTVSFGSADR